MKFKNFTLKSFLLISIGLLTIPLFASTRDRIQNDKSQNKEKEVMRDKRENLEKSDNVRERNIPHFIKPEKNSDLSNKEFQKAEALKYVQTKKSAKKSAKKDDESVPSPPKQSTGGGGKKPPVEIKIPPHTTPKKNEK